MYLEGVSQNLRMINGRVKTTSGQFFGIYKTEVQTVILRCLVGQNVIWFKSYDNFAKMQKTHKTQKTLHRLDFFLQNCRKRQNGNNWGFFCIN